ncbi:MAG: alpha/beta fold hydrolase [Firmicutes bacterium]|nr:alpha/beta fold hydrolase [Bacillota bacterium]
MLDLYRTEGAAAAALLVHGLGSSRRVQRMSRLARELNRRGLDAWVADFPNHGNEASGGFEGLSFPAWVEDLRLLLEMARPHYDRLFLFGHSLGGTACLAAALEEAAGGGQAPRQGGRLAGVAVMSAPSWPLANPEYQERLEAWRERGYLLRFDERAPDFLLPWRYAAEILERYPRPAWEKALGRLAVPLLVVHGSEDEVIPPEEGRRLVALVPGARLELFDAGHEWRNFSTQKKANRLVADFFAALAGAPAPAGGSPRGAQAPPVPGTAGGGAGPVPAAPPATGPRLRLLPGRLALLSLPAGAPLPGWAREPRAAGLAACLRSDEELSLVLPEEAVPPGREAAGGWRALALEGPLDLALVGVLEGLLRPLAAAGVPVFALSSYRTDFLLVPEERLAEALAALRQAGFRLEGAE